MSFSSTDQQHMLRALELAAQGQGWVEPNPMVGCVIARGEQVLGEGWHQAFGGPHAEVNALAAAGDVRGATVYVTLEPCCHQGKTPPCSLALMEAGVGEVVIAQTDPFPQVAGQGIRALQAAGINVRHGLLEASSAALNAPYLKMMQRGRPWVIAKWAMTLDGKIASHTGNSQWISSEASRQRVHQLRGRMDAIMVGIQTAIADDPLLTARPPGARVARRIIVDSTARLPLDSQLVRTAHSAPTFVATGPAAPKKTLEQLRQAGVDVWNSTSSDADVRLEELLKVLGAQQCTNLLVEGGGTLLGCLFDRQLVDEVHVFVAPKIVGGSQAVTAVAGRGFSTIAEGVTVENLQFDQLDGDLYIRGRLSSFPA